MKEEMKKEAVKRMKALGLHQNVIKEFEEESKLNNSAFNGSLFWLSEEVAKKVEEIQNQYECIIYHVVQTNTDFGMLYSMLMVSKYSEDWEMENECIPDGIVFSYVWNTTTEWCSEMGSIGVINRGGGLVRTA